MVSYLDFLFVSCIPDWVLEKRVMQKHQWAQEKKRPKKSLLFLLRGPEKEQLNKTENF